MHSVLANNQILFATAGYDHTIRFWEAHSEICIRALTHNESQVNCMSIYPNKKFLATAGFQHVSIYDINSNNQHAIFNLEGTSKNTVAIGFEEKGSWMYTGGEDKTVKLWDMKEFFRSKPINCIKVLAHNQPITSVSLHPNQIDLIIGDEIGNVLRWDIRTNQGCQLKCNDAKVSIRNISINQEGNMIAAVNNEGYCYVWSIGGYSSPIILGREDIFQPHKRYALKCSFSPDSTFLATSSADGTAKIWRTVDFGLVSECKDNKPRWVWDLAFTCDSEYLFTASSDKSARLWSVKTGEQVKEYIGHQKPIVCLAYSDTK